MATLRYLFAALALGLIAVWGSENLFWTAAPERLDAAGLILTWLAYAVCSGAALSALLWTGARGWKGIFLAGVLLGYGVEGAVVDTIYEAIPFHFVWTAMAWHALLTVLVLGGLWRQQAARRVPWALAAAIGVFGLIWGLYWPLERPGLTGGLPLALYLGALGLAVPLAQIALDRIGTLEPPPGWVLAIAPALVIGLWVIKVVAALSLVKLVFPLVVWSTLWAMGRLGRGPAALDLEPAPHAMRHMAFLIAPAITVTGLTLLWVNGAVWPANQLVAAIAVPVSFGLWLWCLWRAARPIPAS
jgi:hypothetical protein